MLSKYPNRQLGIISRLILSLFRLTYSYVEKQSHISVFRDHFEQYSKLKVNTEYLMTSQTYGFFNQSGDLVAGYCMQWGAERYISLITDPTVQEKAIERLPVEQMMEVTCFWVSPEVTSLRERIGIYFNMYLDVLSYRTKYIITGTTIPSLKSLYNHLANNEIFDGRWARSSRRGWIFWGSSHNLTVNFLIAITVYTFRVLKKQMRPTQNKLVVLGAYNEHK